MTPGSPLAAAVVFRLGPVPVTRPVVTTWGIMAVLAIGSWAGTRRLRPEPSRLQAVLELLVTGIQSQIEEVVRRDARPLLPLLGTLFIFLLTANVCGIVPGVQAPTGRIETPAALALVVFLSVHWFGIRARGLSAYLGSFARPKPIMLPLNLLAEVTRTFSLMVRLFGNIMSGEFLIGIVLALAGLFVPIPLMALELLVGVVQAYIFSMLATVFIGAATADDS
ncbi:MAG: F0F1 ATP synthase subunit A [Proteobacteria bacterium]|nr:F0F1 ATP synthase subunit A [Pseudomonadota bacterium]